LIPQSCCAYNNDGKEGSFIGVLDPSGDLSKNLYNTIFIVVKVDSTCIMYDRFSKNFKPLICNYAPNIAIIVSNMDLIPSKSQEKWKQEVVDSFKEIGVNRIIFSSSLMPSAQNIAKEMMDYIKQMKPRKLGFIHREANKNQKI